MACTVTQADLGKLAASLDPEVAELYIASATSIVLGPTASQQAQYVAWLRCDVDPCQAIKLLAQHLIAADPKSGAGDKDVVSKSLRDASKTYANVSSTAGVFGDSVYGRMFALLLSKFELCQAARTSVPFSLYGGGCGCGS